MVDVTVDQLGREISLYSRPTRIVSLVPSQTELLVHLGLRNFLVGITKFCVHPGDLRKTTTVVGGTKRVHLDRVKRLNPEIILCNMEENTPEMVGALEEIAPVHVSDVRNLDDAIDLIGQYGEIFDVPTKAACLKAEIEKAARKLAQELEGEPPKRAAYLIWKKPWMAVGKDTFIDHLMARNHLENIFLPGEGRYPEFEVDSLKEREAELILLSSEPFPFGEKERQSLRGMFGPARVHLVNGQYFSWYGSRLKAAFEYFRGLYPTLLS